MFSTPFTDSSMGVATVCANVSAVAPGYVALMTTVGGAISGYCATGNVGYATTPKITINVDTTAAKIGRSMKKCGKRMAAPLLLFRRLCGRRSTERRRRWRGIHRARLQLHERRLHRCARLQLREPVEHYAIRGDEARAHDAQAAHQRTGLD